MIHLSHGVHLPQKEWPEVWRQGLWMNLDVSCSIHYSYGLPLVFNGLLLMTSVYLFLAPNFLLGVLFCLLPIRPATWWPETGFVPNPTQIIWESAPNRPNLIWPSRVKSKFGFFPLLLSREGERVSPLKLFYVFEAYHFLVDRPSFYFS